MDGDGDLDIVSIAWREPKYLHLWRNDAVKESSKPYKESVRLNRKYFLPFNVHANGYSRRHWTGHLSSPKWVYFGDRESDRVLYYIHHEDYTDEDVLWHSGEGGMTVFGFGRGPTQENWQQLTNVPAHLTLGFAEKNDFQYVSKMINNAYRSLKVNIGEITKVENK
ncbi:MAG TPA: hypothetical protein DF818_00130 [Bacteroidales bacterium]|nr:hypothetical protein [Bacteroidales bacterium]